MSTSLELLRVLVVDDELVARKRAKRLLAEFEGFELAGECEDGAELIDRLTEGDVDVVLLDINMPGVTGVEAAEQLGEDSPYIIFATAHREHALSAFDLGAVDYLLKPVSKERLGVALGRAKTAVLAEGQKGLPSTQAETQTEAPQATQRASHKPAKLPISTHKGVRLVDPQAISHATFDGELVHLFVDGDEILSDTTLTELLRVTAPGLLRRVHRRALLNLNHVELLEPQDSGGYFAVTKEQHQVTISRQAARRLRKELGIT